MSDEQIQIFISYARDDDDVAPGIPNAMGFVDYLHRQLNHKFKTSGTERPEIWRDVDNIYRGEQFWPKIQQELNKSSLLLVILSANWMASEYCQKELAYFIESLQRRNEQFDERIVVVAKNDIDLAKRPEGLKNQEGYCFYQSTGSQRLGGFEELFVQGRPRDDRYWALVDELCIFLIRRSEHLRHRTGNPPPSPPPDARTVFVAKPATDMLGEYIRVVAELTKHGYNVVPARGEEMPRDRSALQFIDDALAKAEASVHLLGESAGWQPEDIDQKIVELQLARAAARAGAGNGNGAQPPKKAAFHRVVWAPKVFRHDTPTGIGTLERDPHEVVKRFCGAGQGQNEFEGGQVLSDDPGNFRQSLVRMLDQWKPADTIIDPPPRTGAGTKVFVLHHERDRPLARGLRRVMRQMNVEALFPAMDGEEPARKALDKDSIQRSDAIVLCWGNTSETWTRAQARQFEDWRAFGRNCNWEPRSVVLGPPPGEFKAEFKEDPPPSEIDQIVEVTDIEAISPDVVSKIVPRGHSGVL